MTFSRYAIYYVPPEDQDWVKWATAWLGWDVVTGEPKAHPDLDLDVAEITQRPRKYGLHATLKPPFRLADGASVADLERAVADLAASTAPVTLDGLAIDRLGRFLALRPVGDVAALNSMAASCVTELDRFRAPAPEAELARRRANGLSAEQDANLVEWGYPYVLDQFRFHITLSGPLGPDHIGPVADVLDRDLGPILPRPAELAGIALVGEAQDGRFRLIHRYAFSG